MKLTYPNGNVCQEVVKILLNTKEILTVESDKNIHSPIIRFHIYEVFTICSRYGIIGPGNLLCHVYSNLISAVKQKRLSSLQEERY